MSELDGRSELKLLRKIFSNYLFFTLIMIIYPSMVQAAQTLGFVSSYVGYPFDSDFKSACPAGYSKSTEENFLETLPPAERERLLLPENAVELGEKVELEYTTGPGLIDMCTDVEAFSAVVPGHPMPKTGEGKYAPGLDLDGHNGAGVPASNTCTHDNFISRDGRTGIDNQYYRVVACSRYHRERLPNTFLNRMKNGNNTILIEITGVDDLHNDSEVEVGIYSSKGPPMVDSQGNVLPHTTMTITSNDKWHNKVLGKIEAGVITTEVVPLLELRNADPRGAGVEGALRSHRFSNARIRFTLNDNGSLSGLVGGYTAIKDILAEEKAFGKLVSAIYKHNCASEYKAMLALADGNKDPQTGRCDALSSALEVQAIPAYVVHPK